MQKIMTMIAIIALLSLGLYGCGQYGSLYLPKSKSDNHRAGKH